MSSPPIHDFLAMVLTQRRRSTRLLLVPGVRRRRHVRPVLGGARTIADQSAGGEATHPDGGARDH